jgi:hypothetical protein
MSAQSSGTAGDPLARHSLSPRELTQILAAERTGEPFLVMRDSEGELRVVALGAAAAALTVGRREGADVWIPWDEEVSGVHAELRRLGEEWTIVDDGLSRNGTFVNGERIGGRQRLRAGDRLSVGRTTVAYCERAAAGVDATAAAAELPEQPALTENQRRVLIALCRPYAAGDAFTVPATNQQIAQEVFLGIEAVKRNLRVLFRRFGLADLPQNQKRAGLVEIALRTGVVSQRDLS